MDTHNHTDTAAITMRPAYAADHRALIELAAFEQLALQPLDGLEIKR